MFGSILYRGGGGNTSNVGTGICIPVLLRKVANKSLITDYTVTTVANVRFNPVQRRRRYMYTAMKTSLAGMFLV